MPNLSINRGTPFSQTAAGTTSASAAQPKAGSTFYLTDISGTSTTAGTWVILCGATGTTVFWQGIANITEILQTPLEIPAQGTLTFLMNGATNTYANISGYYI